MKVTLPYKYARYPDKPKLVTANALSTFKEGDYICQPKLDGYRCIISNFDGNIQCISRKLSTIIPVSDELLAQLQVIIPEGSIYDSEWINRRTNVGEHIYVFTPMFVANKWVGKWTEQERYNFTKETIQVSDSIHVVNATYNNYVAAFEKSEQYPEQEGIVLKHRNAKLIGDRFNNAINNAWFKMRWR